MATSVREKAGEAGGVRAVVLTLRLLEFLAHSDGARGVTEIAKALGTTKARTYRHLRTLAKQGYVVQDEETEKYQVGIGLWLVGRAAAEQFNFLAATRRVMRPLRDQLGHTVTISVLQPDGMLVSDMLRASSPFEIGTKPGSLFPFHASAQGKLALAFGSPELRERVLAGPLEALTARTTTDPKALERELDAARARGWAVAPGQIIRGVNALGAPIFDHQGRLVGTIAIVDSVQYIGADPTREQIAAVVGAAREASTTLGFKAAAE